VYEVTASEFFDGGVTSLPSEYLQQSQNWYPVQSKAHTPTAVCMKFVVTVHMGEAGCPACLPEPELNGFFVC